MTFGILLLLFVIIVYYTLIYRKQNSRTKQPPGPIGLPIFGHALFLGAEPYKTFLNWKQKYGPIISIRIGNFPVVVITDYKMIKETLAQYSAADRPRTDIFSKISHGHKGLTFGCAHGAMEQRPFIIKNFKDFGVGRNTMEEKITEEVKLFLKELEDEVTATPSRAAPIVMNFRFKSCIVNSFLSIFMSKKIDRNDSKFHALVKQIHCAMSSPGILGEMAMYMPWLAKLVAGVSGLEKQIKAYHAVYEFIEEEIVQHDKTRIPNHPRDFTDAYLDKVDATTDPMSTFHKSQNYRSVLLGDIFFASLDTTSTILEWLIINLVRNPEVQTKIFEEVTRVTSQNSRLPCLSDRKSMPYTDAVTHEILRFPTVAPFGLVHFTLEDTPVQNYVIPKGTMVIPNFYGIHHDPENFQDPETFRPERFLKEIDGRLMRTNVDGYLPFSTGKRACAGKTLAMDNLFLFTASLVQKFIFDCWENELPSLEMNHGTLSTPNKFRVKVSLRND